MYKSPPDVYDKDMGGDFMFKRRNYLRVLSLTVDEKRLLVQAMIRFRNKLVALNKPTEDVNDILLRLL